MKRDLWGGIGPQKWNELYVANVCSKKGSLPSVRSRLLKLLHAVVNIFLSIKKRAKLIGSGGSLLH